MSGQEQEIEYIVNQMAAAGFLVILQHLEIRPSLVVHDDDFAVQNHLKAEFLQRLSNGGELLVERDLVAAVKGNFAVLDLGNGAVTVPLHLKKPVRMIKRFPDQGGEHR